MDAGWVLVICCTFSAFLTAESKWINVDGTFVNPALPWTLWPNNEVPFYIDQVFTQVEVSEIRTAIHTVAANLDPCVRFTEVLPESPVFKLRITSFTNDRHVLSNRCRTYPGKIFSLEKAGLTEQPMVLVNGTTGCLGQGFRPLLKYFALVLGKRNEHQRPNRDEFLHINHDNLDDVSKVAYKAFSEHELFSACTDYDYCSVTHNQPTDFTTNGSLGFIVKKEPYFIPQLYHLSECDCVDVKTMYGCVPSCKKLNCAAQRMQLAPLERQQPCLSQPAPITTHSVWTSVQSTSTSHQICYTMPVTSRSVTRSVTTRIEPTTQSRQGNGLCQVTAQTGMGNSGVPLSVSFTMRQKRNVLDGTPAERALNFDPKFVKWPGNTVPYYLDPSFSPDEQKRIKDAFAQVSTELRGCVVYSEVPSTAGLFKVKVTPTESVPGTFPPRGCHSFPGASQDRIGVGKNEQEMLVRNGLNGCTNDTQTLLRLAAIVLGKRFEHQRQDRDDALTINQASIGPEIRTMFEKYSFQNASLLCGYDYCSVTHIRADEFSTTPGVAAFTVKNAPLHIPRLNKLSECDCKEISFLYNCPLERCTPTNCASIPPPLPPTITGPNLPVPGSSGTNQNQPIPPSNPIPHNLSIPTDNPQNITPSITISIPMNVSPGSDGSQVQMCYTLPVQNVPISFTVNPGMSIGMSMGNLQTLVTLNGCSNINVPSRPDWPTVNPFPPRPTAPVTPEIPTMPTSAVTTTMPTSAVTTTIPASTSTSMQTSTSVGNPATSTTESISSGTPSTPTVMTSATTAAAPTGASTLTTGTVAPVSTTTGSMITSNSATAATSGLLVTSKAPEFRSTPTSDTSVLSSAVTSSGSASLASTVTSTISTGTTVPAASTAVSSGTLPAGRASSVASTPSVTQDATTATTRSSGSSADSTANSGRTPSTSPSGTPAATTNTGISAVSTTSSGFVSSASQGVITASPTSSGSSSTPSTSSGTTQTASALLSTATSASGPSVPSLTSTTGIPSSTIAAASTPSTTAAAATTVAAKNVQSSTIAGQGSTGTVGSTLTVPTTTSTVSTSTGTASTRKLPIGVDDHRAEVDPSFFEYAFRAIETPTRLRQK